MHLPHLVPSTSESLSSSRLNINHPLLTQTDRLGVDERYLRLKVMLPEGVAVISCVFISQLHTDMDIGDGRTKYMLEGEGVGSVFVIDGNTGNIHVTKSLDREEKDQYRLIATATDRQTGRALEPSSEFIIRVQDINDNPPVFLDEPYVATVPEMANIGTRVEKTLKHLADIETLKKGTTF